MLNWRKVTRNFLVIPAVICFWGQAARAAPQLGLFDEFIRNCASHAGDAAASLNAASQQGWRPIPQTQLMQKIPPISVPGMKTDWYRGTLNVQARRSLALFAGQGEMFSGTGLNPVPVAFCMAMQKPADLQSAAKAGNWTNSFQFTSSGANAYLFSEGPGGRRPIALSEIYREFHGGSGRELVTMTHSTENVSGIMIVAPVHTAK